MKRYEALYGEMDTAIKIAARAMNICNVIESNLSCDVCPFGDRCTHEHNGVMDYLMEEVEE